MLRKDAPYGGNQENHRVAKSTIDAEALRVGEAIEGLIYLNKLWEGVSVRALYWEAYADASFGNIEDCHTQLGCLIALTDGKKSCTIWWKSRQSQ